MEFGVLGALSIVIAIVSLFLPDLKGMAAAFIAVGLGFFGTRKKEKLAQAGMIIGGIVLIFINLQNMKILNFQTKNGRNIQHYVQATRLSNKAFAALKAGASPTGKTAKTTQKIIDYLGKSLREAESVETKIIEPHIPGFTGHFQNEFIEGVKHLREGYASSNVGEKLKGAVLLDKWGKWNLKNKKALSRLWNEQPSLFRAVVRN